MFLAQESGELKRRGCFELVKDHSGDVDVTCTQAGERRCDVSRLRSPRFDHHQDLIKLVGEERTVTGFTYNRHVNDDMVKPTAQLIAKLMQEQVVDGDVTIFVITQRKNGKVFVVGGMYAVVKFRISAGPIERAWLLLHAKLLSDRWRVEVCVNKQHRFTTRLGNRTC